MGSDLFNSARLNAGDMDELLDLGLAYSTGSRGCPLDLVIAHQWLNLAALAGSQEAQYCRADIADQMTRQQIGEAQRRARTWLAGQSAH